MHKPSQITVRTRVSARANRMAYALDIIFFQCSKVDEKAITRKNKSTNPSEFRAESITFVRSTRTQSFGTNRRISANSGHPKPSHMPTDTIHDPQQLQTSGRRCIARDKNMHFPPSHLRSHDLIPSNILPKTSNGKGKQTLRMESRIKQHKGKTKRAALSKQIAIMLSLTKAIKIQRHTENGITMAKLFE